MKTRTQTPRPNSYDKASIVFHWITAFLVIVIFALALVPGVIKGSIALHGTLGLLLLLVMLARLVWRFAQGGSIKREGATRFSHLLATSVHGLLYLLLAIVPLLGLAYVDAKGIDFRPFGIPLPQMVQYDRGLAQSIYLWKTWIAYAALMLMFVHAAIAIAYHHLFRRDNVLRSMLKAPGQPAVDSIEDEEETQPAAAVPAAFPRRSFLLSNS